MSGERTNLKTGLVIVILLGFCAIVYGDVIYVDASRPPGGDGQSWGTAYKYLQDGLIAATNGDEIWVAEGIYKPDQGGGQTAGNRNATFQLKNGVKIYGGFAPDDNPPIEKLQERNWKDCKTILSGDLQGDDGPASREDYEENSYHVVTSIGTDTTAMLDGFTIQSGNADGESPDNSGGGMYCSDGGATIYNCIILLNMAEQNGGGIYSSNSNLIMVRCTLQLNWAFTQEGRGNGNGMYNDGGTQQLINCKFMANAACLGYGGAIYNNDCEQTLTNCLMTDNGAWLGGGAVCCASSCKLTMVNCTTWNNWADIEGAGLAAIASIEEEKSTILVRNCILWDYDFATEIHNNGDISDIDIIYSDVRKGGWPGVGNIDEAPMFTSDGLLKLRCWANERNKDDWSPCLDAASNKQVPFDVLDIDGLPFPPWGDGDTQERTFLDLDDTPRFQCATETRPQPGEEDPPTYSAPRIVDMGAYEAPERIPPPNIPIPDGDHGGTTKYVDGAVAYTGDGTSWFNPLKYLQDALEEDDNDANHFQIIMVAQGTYPADTNSVHPSGTGNRKASFKLKKGTRLHGGYAGYWASGGSVDPNRRNVKRYKTFLSGDLDGNDTGGCNDPSRNENSYHIVDGNWTNASAILDGFTIIGGNADGNTGEDRKGGGIYNMLGSPTVTNCTFVGNSAKSMGGGMYNFNGSDPTVTNCILSGNSADSRGGGMSNSYYSSPTVTNCTLAGNSADVNNAGIYCFNSGSITLSNSILWGNYVGGNYGEYAQIYSPNSVTVSYCCVQGWTGTICDSPGNIDKDPLFVNSNLVDPNNDFRLKSMAGHWSPDQNDWVTDGYTSPCIDAGNPGYPLDDEPNDANNLRINMGAYGGTVEASRSPANWSLLADLTNDGTVDFNDLGVFVGCWLDNNRLVPADLNRIPPVNMVDYALLAQNWLEKTSWCGL